MPHAIFSAYWNPREGPKLVMIYPEIISKDALLDIFGLAVRESLFGSEGFVPGYYVARIPQEVYSKISGSIAVYVTGGGKKILMGVFLKDDENPYLFKGALIWNLIEYFNKGATTDKSTIELLWQKILTYPRMPLEQKIMDILADDVTRKILEVLRQEGYMLYSDLVKTVLSMGVNINIDILRDYIRVLEGLGILYVDINPVQLEEFVYLVKYPVIILTRPKNIKKLVKKNPAIKTEIKKLIDQHLSRIKNWTEIFAPIFENPQAYDLLSTLRDGPIRDSDLSPELTKIIDLLSKEKIVAKIGDSYHLLFDPKVAFVFPEKTVATKARTIIYNSDNEIELLTLIRWFSILERYY